MKTTKCLNEWNAIIEALGNGKQTVLIRKYGTSLKGFLLYPTVSYAKKDDVLDCFQEEYKSFANENLLPKSEDKKFEVKYYAQVEKIIEKSSNRIGSFNKYHIWTKGHVKSYLGHKTAEVWLLRVYKLKESKILSRTRGMLYANVSDEVSLDGMTPVISDKDFEDLKSEILKL
jgi:hypothetical protein